MSTSACGPQRSHPTQLELTLREHNRVAACLCVGAFAIGVMVGVIWMTVCS